MKTQLQYVPKFVRKGIWLSCLIAPAAMANITADYLEWSGTIPAESAGGAYEIKSAEGYPSMTSGVMKLKSLGGGMYEVEGSTELAFNVVDTANQDVKSNFDIKLRYIQATLSGVMMGSQSPEMKLIRSEDGTEITKSEISHTNELVQLRLEPGLDNTFKASPGELFSVRTFIEISNVN